MTMTTMEKGKVLRRNLEHVEVTFLRQEKDKTTLRFSASSEMPVERWFGTEILSHEKSAVRLQRAKAGAVPFLFNHNRNDVRGMVDDAAIENKKLVVDAHFFETPPGQELRAMVEGGLRNVSIAYRLHVVEDDRKKNIFTATDWEPLEVSVVSIPEDHTVGIGRSVAGHDDQEYEVQVIRRSPADEIKRAETSAAQGDAMSKTKEQIAAEAAENARAVETAGGNGAGGTGARAVAEVTDPPKAPPNAVDFEKSRKRAIENLCKANNLGDDYRDMWVGNGASIEQVSEDILRILEERGKSNPQPASRLGLTPKETKVFSLARAILACKDKDWKHAGFEAECSRALSEKLHLAPDPNKFYVPFEVMQRPVDQAALVQEMARRHMMGMLGARDLNVATAGQGGFLVSTENQGFIELLRNRSVIFSMGARRLMGLQGNVTVPRQSASGTAFWLSTETTQITESQQAFVQMALTPKTVGAYTEISRLLLLQSSPSAEAIVTDDLAQVVALAADLAGLEGSGAAGQPTGIANTAGIGSVVGTSIDYAKVLEFQVDLATANVRPVRGGYVTTPSVAALLMQRARFANTDTPLWVGNIWDGQIAGFPGMSSNQLAAASKIFGDWQELVVGEWGVLEVEINPVANFQAGIIGVRALYSLDIGVRRPFAFSRATAIT